MANDFDGTILAGSNNNSQLDRGERNNESYHQHHHYFNHSIDALDIINNINNSINNDSNNENWNRNRIESIQSQSFHQNGLIKNNGKWFLNIPFLSLLLMFDKMLEFSFLSTANLSKQFDLSLSLFGHRFDYYNRFNFSNFKYEYEYLE